LSCNSLVLPGCRRGGEAGAQEGGLKGGFTEYEIQQRGIVRLNDEEEELFERNVKQRRTDDDMAGVAPDAGANQVRIPRYCCGDSDLALLSTGTPRTVVLRRTTIRKTTLKTSSLVNSGRYSRVSSTAGGMVYLTWLPTADQYALLSRLVKCCFTYTIA
jgi:hypothetical protein